LLVNWEVYILGIICCIRRVPGCGFTNRSRMLVHNHYRDSHPEFDYLGSLKVMIDRDAGWPEVRRCFVRLGSCPQESRSRNPGKTTTVAATPVGKTGHVEVKKEPEEVVIIEPEEELVIIEPEEVVTTEQLVEKVVAKERAAWVAKQVLEKQVLEAGEARARLMARMNR
jgi:hypothetical protein